MADERPFYGIQAVGLYGRESPQTSVEAMASRYIAEMKSVQPSGPYALGGYCFGGLVAYEMANQLLAEGDEVALVAMFNAPSATYNQRFNPVFDNEGALTDDQGSMRRQLDRSLRGASSVRSGDGRPPLLRNWRIAAIAPVRLGRSRVWVGRSARRTDRGEVNRLAVRLRRPLPDRLREANVFQRIARDAQDRYAPPRVDVPIVVYRAEGLYYEPALGWDEYSTDNSRLCRNMRRTASPTTYNEGAVGVADLPAPDSTSGQTHSGWTHGHQSQSRAATLV